MPLKYRSGSGVAVFCPFPVNSYFVAQYPTNVATIYLGTSWAAPIEIMWNNNMPVLYAYRRTR